MQVALSNFRLRNIFEDAFHQRNDVLCWGEAIIEPAILSRTIEGWEIKLCLSGIQVEEKFKNGIMHLVWTTVWLIHLVDHNDGKQVQLKGLLQHETGLWHGTLEGIHQEDNTVCHFQYTLHLTTEVGVAWSVYHIDFYVFISNRSVLAENGDAAFLFKIVAVHDQITSVLVVAKNLGSLQNSIYQGCLTMVNVGNNSDVSNVHNLV